MNNNKIEELRQDWDGIGWGNFLLIAYTYIPTGIEQQTDVIKLYVLSNNYPNPFNPSTTIKYQIPKRSNVIIKVFSLLGEEVKMLMNEEQEAGIYEIEFNAKDLPSGVYFYQLRAGDFIQTMKMILMK